MKINININTENANGSDLLTQDSRQKFYEKFKKISQNPAYGFFNLTQDLSHLENSKRIYEKFKARKNFIQIGIGGSALGPQMLIDALGKKNDKNFLFLDNTDSEDIFDKLQRIDLKDSLFYIVSKSGGTAETIASFIICYNKLLELGITEKEMKDYFVFSTDPKSGELRELANSHGYQTLEIPSNIGGRFSVLTSVGLLPALFAQIDIDQLFAGANSKRDEILKDEENSDLLELASTLKYLYDQNIDQTILMPYSSKLKSLSHWFVQLWGESLGKSNVKGIAQGLTPIPAYGATDQHSHMQLFMEGKNDKVLMLLEIEKRASNFKLENNLSLNSAKKLSYFDLNSLLSAQLKGTLRALSDRDRNTVHIQIKENNEFAMGQMIIFFESLTALMGSYLEVDPFNQPGVELGKKYAFEYLNS